MLRSAFLILSGNAFGSLILLIRTVVVAHLISVSDFGITATFALVLTLLDMVSAIGVPQQIVQNAEGDRPHFLNTMHGLQGVRGLVNGLLLLLLADPVAAYFKMPEMAWAYRVLAIVPVLSGLVHLDPQRLNRRMEYRQSLAATVLSALISLAAVWPLSRVFADYRLMLGVLIAQAAAGFVLSHVLSQRRYRWAFDRGVIRGALRFGWPVVLGAILLFLVFNGERLIVGRELGMSALAVFSMAFSLVLTPTLVLEGSAQSFFLPQLSAARDDPPRFACLADATLQSFLLIGAVTLLGVALLGGPVVHLLLGAKYAESLPLLTWLAILQGIRVSKGGASSVTVANGITQANLYASLPRVLLLPIAWYVTTVGGSLLEVIWLGCLGEIIGFAAALLFARARLRLSLRPLLPTLGIVTLMFLVGLLHAVGQSRPDLPHLSPWVTSSALVLLFGLAIAAARDVRSYVRNRNLILKD